MGALGSLNETWVSLDHQPAIGYPPSMTDAFEKCRQFLKQPFGTSNGDRDLAEAVYTSLSPAGNAGPWMDYQGHRILQFGTNDYLGLASHPAVRQRAAEVAAEYGIGQPMGSRLLTGSVAQHVELESKLARFKGTEDAILFSAGAMAMIGALTALAGANDVVFIDENAHATLRLGARASSATIRVFRHNDPNHLESILKKSDPKAAKIVVVDGVYSMQGDVAPLPDLVDLRRRFGFRLFVDDAHANGVFGPQGRGTPFHFGVQDEVDLHLGTFSKAFGTIGGFAAGSYEVVTYLRYHAPTYIFTKALPLVITEATIVALELLQAADDRRAALWNNAQQLQTMLREAGFYVGPTQSPITPIYTSGFRAVYWALQLREKFGIWGSPSTYPAVKMGQSLLRVIPTALHTPEDIRYLVESLKTIEATLSLGQLMPVI